MKSKSTFFRFLIFAMIFSLILSACGGSEEESSSEPDIPEEAPSAPVEDTPVEDTLVEDTSASNTTTVTSLEDVQSAVIQIEAQGSFSDPELGMQFNTAGRGSGFIINEAGIAVTNNHVVTGAALLKVWVGGETEARNAKILGVSECSDLAVIDIDGDGFPYLEWHEGDINVGLDIYAAGFPLGDPEFTLTRGIVSKARTSGETVWASVDEVIEHDATINPGNSGGPLIDADGRIVAVNYAGSSGTNQYFAIARAEALAVIEQLQAAEDVTSIGVNGTAVNNGEGLSGIWVSSVKSGSPADQAGIALGDIITSMEGLVLATDGTMADYCDILRTHNPEDTLNIEVLRYDTQEVLEGQLNGRALETSFSFAQTLDEEVADTGSGGDAATYDNYVEISDDTGALVVEVPAVWSDINGSAWLDGEDEIGIAVSAAPNLDDFWGSWTMPGMFFGASTSLTLTEAEILDVFEYYDSCDYEGRSDYEDSLYTGLYDVWSNCGGGDSHYIVLSASPEARNFILVVSIQVVSDADLDALDHVLDSFVVKE